MSVIQRVQTKTNLPALIFITCFNYHKMQLSCMDCKSKLELYSTVFHLHLTRGSFDDRLDLLETVGAFTDSNFNACMVQDSPVSILIQPAVPEVQVELLTNTKIHFWP